MIPTVCLVKHDPDAGLYGDCVRACIASILELNTEDVPHFIHDGCDAETANGRITEWLLARNLAPFWSGFNGDDTLESIFEHMEAANKETHYMLFGSTENADHVVVCKGGKIVHDPSWSPGGLNKPGSNGLWTVLVITVNGRVWDW